MICALRGTNRSQYISLISGALTCASKVMFCDTSTKRLLATYMVSEKARNGALMRVEESSTKVN
jgi:hypothetical protein